jgi:hypothetical protein
MSWDDCEHEWVEKWYDDVADGKPGYTQMLCKKCKCPGERDDTDGSIFWPCT